MLSDANNQSFISLTIKKYLFKLRAYTGYFCGFFLAQILASILLLSVSKNADISSFIFNITMHTYSSQLILVLSVLWAFIISILISSQFIKNASFTLPGNRLSECCSDFVYIITGCLLGAISAALCSAAIRTELYFSFKDSVFVQGFYPSFTDLITVATATFLYMLAASAAGYFAGSLIRISKVFFVVIAVLLFILNYTYFTTANLVSGRSVLAPLWHLLFKQRSLAIFAITMVVLSAALYLLSTFIANRTEVKR